MYETRRGALPASLPRKNLRTPPPADPADIYVSFLKQEAVEGFLNRSWPETQNSSQDRQYRRLKEARQLQQLFGLTGNSPILLAALHANQNAAITRYPWADSQTTAEQYPYPSSARITGIQAPTAEAAAAQVRDIFGTHAPDIHVQIQPNRLYKETKGKLKGTWTAKPTVSAGPQLAEIMAAVESRQLGWQSITLPSPLPEELLQEYQMRCKVTLHAVAPYAGTSYRERVQDWFRAWNLEFFQAQMDQEESRIHASSTESAAFTVYIDIMTGQYEEELRQTKQAWLDQQQAATAQPREAGEAADPGEGAASDPAGEEPAGTGSEGGEGSRGPAEQGDTDWEEAWKAHLASEVGAMTELATQQYLGERALAAGPIGSKIYAVTSGWQSNRDGTQQSTHHARWKPSPYKARVLQQSIWIVLATILSATAQIQLRPGRLESAYQVTPSTRRRRATHQGRPSKPKMLLWKSKNLLGHAPHHIKIARARQHKRHRARQRGPTRPTHPTSPTHTSKTQRSPNPVDPQTPVMQAPPPFQVHGGSPQPGVPHATHPRAAPHLRAYPHILWCRQEAMNCWLHAHNMLTQNLCIHPQNVVTSLRHEIQDPHCIGRDNIILSFRDGGPFGVMAINRYLFKHAAEQVYYKTVIREAQTLEGLNEAQFKALLPQGTKGACIAFEPPGYGTGHMKCIRYVESDDTWYALDSMVPPYITPLTTEGRWKEHTKATEAYVLMETTHFQGPSMGAHQPRHCPHPSPATARAYDLTGPFVIHQEPIRRVTSLYTPQELEEYCPNALPQPQQPQQATSGNTPRPGLGRQPDPAVAPLAPRLLHPPTARPPPAGRHTTLQTGNRRPPKGTRQDQSTADIRQFFRPAIPGPRSQKEEDHQPPTSQSPQPPQFPTQPLHRTRLRQGNKDRKSKYKAPWIHIAVRKKGIKQQYKRLKQSHASALYNQTRAPSAQHMQGCRPSEEKLKIVTINGRGLKTKISILRLILGTKPDVIIWTEHQMATATTVPRWVHILLQGYRWGHTSLPNIRGQAGVLMAVHKDVLAGTEAHVPAQPPEAQGYIYQMEIQRPESAPLMITGVYLPTGTGAHLSRPTLYKHLKASLDKTKDHVHIVAGDMNAALYQSDRDPGRKGQHDKAYRGFIQETGLRPIDPPNPLAPVAQRARTFRREAGEGEDVSRIDDILLKGTVDTAPGASTHLIDTKGLNTDHQGLCAEIPYTTIYQLPLPVIEETMEPTVRRTLTVPMTHEDKRILTHAVEERQTIPIRSLWQDLKQLLDTQIHPYWHQIDTGVIKAGDPKWAPQQQLQKEVNALGDRMTAILKQALSTAMEVCSTTVRKPHSTQHHQKRSTARQRTHLLKMRRKIRETRRDDPLSPTSWKQDQELVKIIKQVQDRSRTGETQEDPLASDAQANVEEILKSATGILVDQTIKEKLKELDKKDASYTVQKHRSRMQKLADKNQKVGNKIMTGQYNQSNKYALRILKDGDKILTKPEQILHKCHSSLQHHHQVPPPTPPAETYPWEAPQAQDPFRLETEAHQGACTQGLHHLIQDKAEFHRCINNLSTGKQPGPDEIPNEIIKAAPALLKDCLYMLIQAMWATGITPERWKESYTILIFKNKGTILELDYYRRIGLENTLYKCWTKVVQGAFAAYADKHNILSQEQGGFRAHRNTIHQLETHTMLLEDARLMGQDLFLVMVDLKEAFDTIDHTRMLKVLRDLGYPDDALQVVQGLYHNATTKVATPYGHTAPIRIQRGTLQGDSLSPFLFILYLEPLLRWLSVGARGYQPGVLKNKNPNTTFSNSAYADDLSIYTGGQSNLHIQLAKISSYCTWAGLIISHTKTLATAALYKRLPDKPLDYNTVQRILATIRMQEQPVQIHDPKKPYKLLGIWYTMDLNWTKQWAETKTALKDMAVHLGRSYNTQAQKLRTLQTCLAAKARYAFPLICYTDHALEQLDKTLDKVVRQAYRLPPGTPTAFLREDLNKGGLGQTSLKVAYTTTAVKNLTHAYAEEGKRGMLTRALLAAQHQAFTHPTAQAQRGWIPDYSLRLRQLIQGHKADIHMWRQGEQPFALPDNEIMRTIMGHPGDADNPPNRLQKIRKPLQRLSEIGILSISQLLTKKGTRVLTSQELARNISFGPSPLPSKYTRALAAIAQYLAAAPGTNPPKGPPAEQKVHAEHQGWIRTTLRKERAILPVPTPIHALITQAPRRLQPGAHLHCGGKRKQKLRMDPEFREADDKQYDPPEDEALPQQTRQGDETIEPMDAEAPDPHQGPQKGDTQGTPTPLTRHERAKCMLRQKHKPVEVYNQLCSYKDKVEGVTGEWRLRTQHTKKPLHKRQLLRKQIQWKVQWSPTVLEKWEKDLAVDHLKYTPATLRLATEEEINSHLNAICEHCHEEHDTITCSECRRGYHPRCQPQTPDTGQCSQCHTSQSWRSSQKKAQYREEVQHWYIEWEPQWEDEKQLRQLGYGAVVDTTLKEMAQPQAPPPPKPQKDAHLTNMERQGNTGPRYHSTLGDPLRAKCSFDTEDTDPHTDIVGTGQYEIQIRPVPRRHTLPNGTKKDYHREMVTIHDPRGRTMGMITPERARLLYRNYCQTMKERPEVVLQLEPQSFAEELARLIHRYKNGTRIPGSKRRVDLTNHWATPPAIYQELQRHLPQMHQERFASPLNYHPGMQRYWSCFERDQIFGALHDAYSHKWTGLSVANPEYDSQEMYKAVSWAVHSSQATDHPTLTAFVLPAWTGGSNTAYLKWTQKRPDLCHTLTTIPRKSFKFVPPESNTLGMDAADAGHPRWDVTILLVGNKAGYTTSFGDQMEKSMAGLKRGIMAAINQHTQNTPPLSWSQITHYPTPDMHPTRQPSNPQQLDPLLFRPSVKVKDLPEDADTHWKIQLHSDPLSWTEPTLPTTDHPLKHDWTAFAYTDGSQKKIPIAGAEDQEVTVIGSGLYAPATNDRPETKIRIRAKTPGHNTAYRAELIAILGALKEGYHQILTDSVNSIHAIKSTIHYPATTRFHRHRNLLQEIKAAIMAAAGPTSIMKIRAHAGIPGNEWADDLAAQAAVLDQAELDLSEIDSNDRPQGLWPAQKQWEEHPTLGEQLKWKPVENLEDALHNRVQRTANLRLGQADTTTIYYAAMQKAMPDIAEEYMDTWHRATGVTEGMKNTRIKYLTGQLPTAKNLQRYKVKKTSICPCCNKHPDGGHHAIAWCPAIMGRVQEKHNEAVRIITKAIAEGDKGAHQIVYNDGGAPQKWQQSGSGNLHRTITDIPAGLISKEELQQSGSRPDILLYRRKQHKRNTKGSFTTRQAEITLVEVKYVRDSDPTSNARDPHAQHRALYDTLRKKHPKADLRKSIILLGVAGTVYTQHTIRELARLGVRGQHQKRTVMKLQRMSIQALHETWKQRMNIIHRPQRGAPGAPEAEEHRTSPVEGWGEGRDIRGGDDRDVGGGWTTHARSGKG